MALPMTAGGARYASVYFNPGLFSHVGGVVPGLRGAGTRGSDVVELVMVTAVTLGLGQLEIGDHGNLAVGSSTS